MKKTQISRREIDQRGNGRPTAAAIVGCLMSRVGKATHLERENQRQGTSDWMMTKHKHRSQNKKYRCPSIEGYCSPPSIRAGQEMDIDVSTNPRQISRSTLRMGTKAARRQKSNGVGQHDGKFSPDHHREFGRVRVASGSRARNKNAQQLDPAASTSDKLTEQKRHSKLLISSSARRKPTSFSNASRHHWQAYPTVARINFTSTTMAKASGTGARRRCQLSPPYGKILPDLDCPIAIVRLGEFFLSGNSP